MVLLDADSIMTGRALVQAVAMMEEFRTSAHSTAPRIVHRRDDLHADSQLSPTDSIVRLFSRGAQLLAQHDGTMGTQRDHSRAAVHRACALPTYPVREPFGGRIMSHDFVEAALMRRAAGRCGSRTTSTAATKKAADSDR